MPTVVAFTTSFRIPRILQYFLWIKSTQPNGDLIFWMFFQYTALPSNIQQEYHYIDSTTKQYTRAYSTTFIRTAVPGNTFISPSLPGNIPTHLPLHLQHYRAIYLQRYLYIQSTTVQYTCSSTFMCTTLPRHTFTSAALAGKYLQRYSSTGQ